MATAFTRAYRKARLWVTEAPADEVAAREAVLFPNVDLEALVNSIARYQKVGCWEGDLTITRDLYYQALKVFLHSDAISARHPYEEVVVPPPA